MMLFRLLGKKRFRKLLWLPAAPALLWVLIVLGAPTEWARSRIERDVASALGRPVKLGGVKLGWTGKLKLLKFSAAEKSDASNPWLSVEEAGIDLSLGQILTGTGEPSRIEVNQLALRVWRKGDGKFEFDDLLRSEGPSSTTPVATSDSTVPESKPTSEPVSDADTKAATPAVEIVLTGARVSIVDDQSGTRLDFSDVDGRAQYVDDVATVEFLAGKLNDGDFQFAGRFERSAAEPRFIGELRLRDVSLQKEMKALRFLAPVVSDGSMDVDGKVALHLALEGEGLGGARLQDTLKGHGAIELDPINLDGSRILAEIDSIARLPQAGRVGSVRSDFAIENRRVRTENLTIKVAGVPLELSGWTDFDGRLDYLVKAEKMMSKLPREARGLLSELSIDVDQLASLHLKGTFDSARVSVESRVPPTSRRDGGTTRRNDPLDANALRDAGKRLRDRLRR